MAEVKNGNALVAEYAAMAVRTLTSQEEVYVSHCIRGLNPSAACRAAGYTNVPEIMADFAERRDIQTALAHGREVSRQLALQAGQLDFTRDDATRLYLEAHSTADTAAERIRAVDSLVKLHGLSEPDKKEVVITSRDQLTVMDTEELARIAGSDILLDPSEYEVKK
jgi:hypothetical protein